MSINPCKISKSIWVCPTCKNNYMKRLDIPNFDKIEKFPISVVFICNYDELNEHSNILYIDSNRKVRGIESINNIIIG